MPPVRTNNASQADASSSPLAYSSDFTFGTATPNIQLISPSSTYGAFPDYDLSSPPATKKKRSHGKSRPPGHIPRPPNAFIIFRTDYIKLMATHSTPEMSKNLGAQWKKMSALEKRPWVEKARIAKEEHMKQFPDYKYKPVHPRDAEGKCIRKPRKPKQPRVKAIDAVEHLSTSFTWMEGKSDPEFPSTSLPSNCSSASSPPRSPSPTPAIFYPQPSYLPYRRSSSVPLPGSDERFFFGVSPGAGGSAYPPFPNGPQTGSVSRRLSKRPSTSMDFTCAGPIHSSEMYSHNNAYLAPPGDAPQWRPSHRRSISAPMFSGEIATSQFVQGPSQEFSQAANHLTPINPVFGNIFDKFSWDSMQNAQPSNIALPQLPYTGLDIPSMSHSPLSNGSATPPPSSPLHTPAIQHPAPISTFDFSAFQAHIGDFDAMPQAEARYTPMARESLSNVLNFIPQSYQADHPHPEDAASRDQQFHPVAQQQGHTSAVQYSEEGQVRTPQPYPRIADMNGYEEGLRYTQPAQPQQLDFNELIIEGYH